MAKLPTVADLGGTPQVSGERPLASYEVSPFARGGAALAGGIERAGQGLAKLGEGALDYQLDKGRYEYAQAHAEQLTKKIDLYGELQKDTDYQTMGARYGERIAKINEDAAGLISSPFMRDRFATDSKSSVAQFNLNVAEHARKLEGNANIAYVEQRGDKFINQAVAAPDEATRAQVIDSHNRLVDGLAGRGFITAQGAVAMKKQWAHRYAVADVLRLIDDNPAEAVRRIESADEKSIYSIIPPEQKFQLLHQAKSAVRARAADGLADFKNRVDDTEAEALRTGAVAKPIAEAEFKIKLGDELGGRAYANHQANVQLGADKQTLAGMDPEEQRALIESYAPTAGGEQGGRDKLHGKGGGFRAQAARQDLLLLAANEVNLEKAKDPAQFAIAKLPGVGQAFRTFAQVQADATATPEAKHAVARDYATKTTMEQQRVGLPADRITLLPKGYVDGFNRAVARAADSDDPQKRIGLVAQVQQEAATWGNAWPQVMRQLAPTTQPIVRAIAAGADPEAMVRLLNLGKDEAPAKLLQEQNETKFKDLTSSLNDALAPFRRSLVGRQVDRDYTAYYGLTEKLAALYVRDGDSAAAAATNAFNKLIGDRYEFRDTWRMPKSAGVSADDVQNGVYEARARIADAADKPDGAAFDIAPAADDIGLGKENRADSLTKFARDGHWVTSHDNSGLNLVYDEKFVQRTDGKPLLLTWDALAKLAGAGAGRLATQAARASFGP